MAVVLLTGVVNTVYYVIYSHIKALKSVYDQLARSWRECGSADSASLAHLLGVPVVTAHSPRRHRRSSRRRPAAGRSRRRLTWKDASGAVRFASVTTRDISEAGRVRRVRDAGADSAVPARAPAAGASRARSSRRSAARNADAGGGVARRVPTGPPGAPCGYALRFLVEPARRGSRAVDGDRLLNHRSRDGEWSTIRA